MGASNFKEFGAVLATAGFHVMGSGCRVKPGNVFPDLVSRYFEDVTTPHLFFVSPYLWDGQQSRTLSGKTVGWLMGIPITDAGKQYRGAHGAEELEELLEQGDPDFVDLWRGSVA